MSGWRVRIGLLVPSTNTIVEPEMYNMTPDGVALITSRLKVPSINLTDDLVHENLNAIVDAVENSVELLPVEELACIAFCCTAASFYQGDRGDKEITSRIENRARKPAITTSGAMLAALMHLNMKRICVASPYPKYLNDNLKDFLTDNGITVANLVALDSSTAYENARLSPQTIYELAVKAYREDVDGLFLPCTNWGATQIVDQIETDFGMPVVTAIQATFWRALRIVGIQQPISGFGKLLMC